ncbi:hypothetical protein VTN77DRAFT_8106 [Rasamsonia byssochlamydoides]|uniref:uncharacterized protein n=1 Tax=Rasamsonia byssochlamydoides TaxID=89139 RepID=UPI0037430444
MSETAATQGASQTAEQYYSSFTSSPGLGSKFHDIDDEAHFQSYMCSLQSTSTRNFVLDFGNDDAWCALNLDHDELKDLLGKPKPKLFGTRWM